MGLLAEVNNCRGCGCGPHPPSEFVWTTGRLGLVDIAAHGMLCHGNYCPSGNTKQLAAREAVQDSSLRRRKNRHEAAQQDHGNHVASWSAYEMAKGLDFLSPEHSKYSTPTLIDSSER